MKRRLSRLLFGAVVCATVLLSTNLFAANNPIDRREYREQLRIREGIHSGELTAQEVRKLEKEQARVRATEARAKSDGQLTAKERAKIEKKLSHASRDIYRQKHHNQER